VKCARRVLDVVLEPFRFVPDTCCLADIAHGSVDDAAGIWGEA